MSVGASLDHLICSQQQRRGNGEAEGLGGLEVDDEVELGGLWSCPALVDGELLGCGTEMVKAGGVMVDPRARRDRIRGIPRSVPLPQRRSWRLYDARCLEVCRRASVDSMNALVARGRLVAKRRVAPARIVLAFDIIEEGEPSLDRRRIPLVMDQLGLERGEEALAHCVVVGIPDRAH